MTNHFRIKFGMEMGVVRNETHEYNEMVYSTGFVHRLSIHAIHVTFQLPKKYKRKEIVLMGNSRDSSYGGTYNEETGVVTFTRTTYLAPMNRYTVRVWFPVQKTTLTCAPCSRVDDWLMLVLLIPFFLCFIVPCCIHLYGRDHVKRSGPLTRGGEFDGEGRTLGGEGESGSAAVFCGCCCERPVEEGRPVTGRNNGEEREGLMGEQGGDDSL